MKTSWKIKVLLVIVSLIILGSLIVGQREGAKLLASSPFRLFANHADTPSLEPTPTGKVYPTPLPSQKISVSTPSEIQITHNDTFEIQRLFSPDLSGTQLVAQAAVNEGLAIVLIDLETKKVDLLSEPREFQGAAPKISKQWVVWSEPTDLTKSQFQLHTYDLLTGQLTTPGVLDYYHNLDFSDGVVVWEGALNGKAGIYGYNIKNAQEITIVQTLAGYPYIDYPWVIYLDYTADTFGQRRLDQAAGLWIYNLETQEKFLVGNTFNPDDATAGSYHAIDTHWIAWFGVDSDSDYNIESCIPHIYDLTSHAVTTPDLPIQWPPRVLLSADIAIFGNIGLDLVTNEAFNAVTIPEASDMTGLPLLLSGERLVWLRENGKNTQQVYYSTLTRH